MKFFISSSLCWDYHPKEVITLAKKFCFSGVEMWAEHIYHHDANAKVLRDYAKEEGIALTLHASSWDLNICSINKGIQEQSVKELKKSIDLASQLQVLHMTFHPGRFTVKDYLWEYHQDRLIENTQELLAYAADKQVTLSQELMEPIAKEILTQPKHMNVFQDKVGTELPVTLDIAHVPLHESSIQYLEQLRFVNSIHLSDSSKEQYHVPLGEGEVELQHILEVLSTMDVPIVLEGMDTSRELTFLKKHIQFLYNHKWIERKVSI
ncbi:sugar phosphate isomerase/epimerase [Virgibacillus sp. AGTR]|uniref:sugar phosphate isomerase/epimerase family protein n=1 Tax=Virgibacillus TaxID=84406 RepID=UPI00068507BF|nr:MULTISPECIES: sugar phosphate isomerase/epimerase family protein [Bacillaceae]MCC2252668.1 sugar phosphate isomerase/epimerase [Virgibacillus sp. AGTR]MDY7046683.1 sugar phosphate isomerase/epimerase family protein [Virgibacillus sp. M23]QRZ19239.1 sugar phosphate isomerase/epimerase [Virgibacillus sp. AGTR]WBX81081.1 sugar phosphate isomerase/epimerase [Virgibacillus salarius]